MASDPQDYVPSGFSQTKKPHSCVLVIFGASGDLTKRKLIPVWLALKLRDAVQWPFRGNKSTSL